MIPAIIVGANCTLTAPEGEEDSITDLQVLLTEHGYVSAWRPSPEEISFLVRGGLVLLHIRGPHPAVALTVEAPERDERN